MATDFESLAQLDQIQEHLSRKPELIVLFFFDPLDGQCKRMAGNLDFWSEHVKYKDRVLFVKCAEENSNEIFEKYDMKAIPTFLFIQNDKQVAPPSTGSNLRRLGIETVMDGILNGQK